ncbi:MAG: PadR family transcriptional regulator [Clostridia bacterium]|nr:PadR family transcriptional regulator [Clostridia bacterium]
MGWKDDIEENVRSGIVELLILHLLCEHDMYGYEIRQELSERTNGAYLMKEGSLYGPLYRMQSRGLISAHKEMAGEKRFRMYYHIEKNGMEYLAYGKEQMIFVFSGTAKLLGWINDEEIEKFKQGK